MATPQDFVAALTGLSEETRAAFLKAMLAEDSYTIHPDSTKREGATYNRAAHFVLEECKAYPGVKHDWWVYLPVNYRKDEPARVMFFLDGLEYLMACKVHYCIDNLLADGDIPNMIAVFVGPGDKGPGYPNGMGGTDNRSIEYDSVDDRFVNFIIDEIYPLVAANIPLTDGGHCICGLSSAGNGAFTAAWHRPDVFDKVICHCGSFADLRGGNLYPQKIRTEEKRNIKVSLSSGEQDANFGLGEWKQLNILMAEALKEAGYDYELNIGEGGHNYRYAASLLPDTIRWIYK